MRARTCEKRERPSSPPASCAPPRCVIKIKAVVIGYSFWPRPVDYPFNGDCVKGGKKDHVPMRGVDRKKEIKIRGGVSSELFASRCSDGREGSEEETRGHLGQRVRRARVRGPRGRR